MPGIMKKAIFSILAIVPVSTCMSGQTQVQPAQKGPYTVYTIEKGVYHIEDGNAANPAGNHMDKDGKVTGMNNCSDMYLVVGEKKALLIDLSNFIRWDSTAVESLRSIVYDRAGDRELLITITHWHGDHTGMLPAFKDDTKAGFWIPEEEFKGRDMFPKDRTTWFPEGATLDLGGGCLIATTEVPGHTDHGTLFFIKGRNIVFSGDALGSGSGVWLFNDESFIKYKKGVEDLIEYIEDPANEIDSDKLIIYGGHYWQRGQMEKLTSQYIYDMRTLIDKIGEGTAEIAPASSQMKFLDANFKYGTATITWNKEAAEQYAESFKNE